MATPSKSSKWTDNVSSIAARILFLLIIFQIPLFSSYRKSSPLGLFENYPFCRLIASEIFPAVVVKGLLYPGAAVNGLIHNMTIPSWDSLLDLYNLTNVKEASAVTDLQRLEVLAGSYFLVAGALVGVLKPGRMSVFGNLLIIWGLVKEGILGKPVNSDPSKAVYVYPTMVIALLCAFSSVKYDVKKAVRSAPVRSSAKPLQSSSKSKLK
ncbi:uncharacterized protein HKW66_Vig0098790 [Vigna angularis]|uniref:Uncharacterized protein n=1 Tax=Phaseolus angularis TaxID=3914 RepID=A0A8T0KJX4_PHAAN|nr:uncharacterized protein HKW66_Vig0098790 [Vigna angularis]